jgi:hypothetical protein
MCTVTWIRDEEGYQLFFNRDERLARKAGIPPEIRIANGTHFVAPADGDFGGTWIAVNEFGISVCLLNGCALTGSAEAVRGCKSRGLLIPEIIAGNSADGICARVLRGNLSDLSPFTMAVLTASGRPALIEWSGVTPTFVRDGDRFMPLTSSSYLPAAAREHRRASLEALRTKESIDTAALRQWHASHEPSRGPFSVCMHRGDVQTVSFTAIRVAGTRAFIEYRAGSPCASAADVSISELHLSSPRTQSARASS